MKGNGFSGIGNGCGRGGGGVERCQVASLHTVGEVAVAGAARKVAAGGGGVGGVVAAGAAVTAGGALGGVGIVGAGAGAGRTLHALRGRGVGPGGHSPGPVRAGGARLARVRVAVLLVRPPCRARPVGPVRNHVVPRRLRTATSQPESGAFAKYDGT